MGQTSLHPRVIIKRLFCFLNYFEAFTLIEYCKRCGRSNNDGSFHVSDEIWEQVRSGYNVLCPRCFIKLAHKKIGSGHWRFERLI